MKLIKTPLTEAQQRILAVSLLILPVLLLYFLIAAPYFRILKEGRENIEDLQFQLQRLQKTAAQGPLWRQQLKILKEQNQRNRHYLEGDTPALASAELQKYLSDIIRQAGGELTSTQVIPPREEDKFTRIAVRIRMSGNTEVLREVLHAIETRQPLLMVETMNIRPVRKRRDPKTRKLVATERMNIDMEVFGYMPTPKS